MRRPLVHGLLLAGVAAAAQPAALAGPLDRQSGDYEYRTNPAADDMLRVPGVMGMAYRDAIQVLQLAGLNPRIEKIARIDKRYDGQEGRVVAQTPSPGGVAMIGSSVTVTCYVPPARERPRDGDRRRDPPPPRREPGADQPDSTAAGRGDPR